MVRMAERTDIQATNFNAIRISIASPEQMLNWSHGEVTKPETINYRTLRPEKDGLFCERLFGPTKDWECFCGKYKRIRYRGVICDRCGVEVTRSKVRRERMGHIRLAAPVAHIWFSKTTPSRLGLLLDLSPRNLERVLYFAQHIVVSVDEEGRQAVIDEEKLRLELEQKKLVTASEERRSELQQKMEELSNAEASPDVDAEVFSTQIEIDAIEDELAKQEGELEEHFQLAVDELEDLRVHKLIAESRYRELKDRYGEVFQASMGAEAILAILRSIDLEALRDQLVNEMHSTSGQRRKKAIKRLRVIESFRKSGNRVEDMVLSILPVLPPELRPMVQLDGGRFATSDLNDLYRRVINRNNRLKRLMDLGAPEIIIRNEKRMLQESVDALIDNGRRGRPIQGSHNHKLKSLSDLLRGKQGRFRQNLLGKRVDYSGRSVIVVGPELKMNQCGLPKRMALELFKPFVMHRLVVLGIAPNIKSAKRMVERARPEVWDILEDVIKDRPVMLNRAPTLHRLGIQSFMPVLIEGNAIQIHPLVCSAFNADFDGDQMAVHVPLSRMAVHESRVAMLSTHNMLSPASGDPLVAPTLDMVMGCYYLTEVEEGAAGEGSKFYDFDEVRIAHAAGHVDLRARILVRNVPGCDDDWVETSLGRLIFNEILPREVGFKNELMDRGGIKNLTAELYRHLSNEETADALDKIKALGFHYATASGITIAINDIQVSPQKAEILREAAALVTGYEDQYLSGLMSDDERYNLAVQAWTRASDQTEELVKDDLGNYGGIAVMAVSGAKGNIAQIKQMAGMRGLMSNPKGRIIDLPIKSSFREGLTALEYFISTHGARKGLADTALRTADSGYLTRRLIDIAQEVIALEYDCGTMDVYWIRPRRDDPQQSSLVERILGRMVAAPIAHPETGEIIVDRNEEIDEDLAAKIVEAGITEVPVRSPLNCEAHRGVCQLCYGRLPATGNLVELGQAAGIIAAQSIGEPGTQLTMRTFHTGGIAGTDITSGLPRVEELFEARVPKGSALLADIDGVVEIETDEEGRRLRVVSREEFREDYPLPEGAQLLVDDGEFVEPGMILASSHPSLMGEEGDSEEVDADPHLRRSSIGAGT
ncbi:MAG: DNA-directed RNA polymerase subunit beta', partial [Dehalococcoidia bacterium]